MSQAQGLRSPGNPATVSRGIRNLGQWLCVPPFERVALSCRAIRASKLYAAETLILKQVKMLSVPDPVTVMSLAMPARRVTSVTT